MRRTTALYVTSQFSSLWSTASPRLAWHCLALPRREGEVVHRSVRRGRGHPRLPTKGSGLGGDSFVHTFTARLARKADLGREHNASISRRSGPQGNNQVSFGISAAPQPVSVLSLGAGGLPTLGRLCKALPFRHRTSTETNRCLAKGILELIAFSDGSEKRGPTQGQEIVGERPSAAAFFRSGARLADGVRVSAGRVRPISLRAADCNHYNYSCKLQWLPSAGRSYENSLLRLSNKSRGYGRLWPIFDPL